MVVSVHGQQNWSHLGGRTLTMPMGTVVMTSVDVGRPVDCGWDNSQGRVSTSYPAFPLCFPLYVRLL